MRWMLLFALLLGTAIAQEMPQSPTEPIVSKTEYGVESFPLYPTKLAEGAARAKVQAYCSFCHSTNYITMQPPLPAKTWDAEVHKMIKVYGADIPDNDAQVIIDYLQHHYTPETIGKAPVSDGQAIYEHVCNACHQNDGMGLPQTFPPLRPRVTELAPTPAGRCYLMHAVLFGLSGSIHVQGQPSMGAMPPWGKTLDDDDVAAVLSYIAHRWSPHSAPFKPDEVAGERQLNMTSEQVMLERQQLIGK